MRKIDGPGAVSGRFVDYDAVTNPNGTVYTADYGNDIQDELIGIQEAGGITTGSAGTNLQVLLALYRLQNSISPNVSAWSSVSTYSTAGTLVYLENAVYSATGKAGNLDKDPTVPANAVYWENFDIGTLKQAFNTGSPIMGGMGAIHDIEDALYQQYFKVFRSWENGVEYDYYFVHLDGTTPSETLATILTSYPHLATWQPGGTLLDFRNRHIRIQGSLSGSVGDVLEDAFMKHGHDIYAQGVNGSAGALGLYSTADAGTTTFTYRSVEEPTTIPGDTTIKVSDDETRVKSITLAMPGIIVKVVV